jgi:long-chain acyl-CoA synthetase
MANTRSWTALYDPHVPRSLSPYPDATLVDYLARHANASPDAHAVLFKGTSVTYRQLHDLSSRFASALRSFGVRPGDRVALVLPNCPQFLIAELGAWKAGAVVMPLNPLYTGEELEEPLRSAGTRVVVSLSPFYRKVSALRKQTSVQRIIVTNIKEYLPAALRMLFTVFKERKGGHRVRLAEGDVWFADCLRGADFGAAVCRPDDEAIMLLSGGTTGTPKAVVGRHRHLVAAGLQLDAWLRPPETAGKAAGSSDVALVPLPLFHVYACAGAQTHALISRTPVALVPNPRDIDDLLKTIKQVRPTLFSSVPALFIALLNHPKVKAGAVDLGSIRACFSGAAPLMAATKSRFEELTGGRIVEGYSLTEAMMACVVNPLGGINKLGSVGLPLPDVEVAIFGEGDEEGFLQANQTGEILIRAPQLMMGYWNNSEETARALRAHGEGGVWLHTGDLGYLDQDNYLFIVDRQKDLIKTSGYQVWPREVEEVIASHPAVVDVGVAGVPDNVKGEVVKAWVVCRSGSDLTADALRSYCRLKIAPFKVPAEIVFRDRLPKTMAGKVLRRALKAEQP